MEVRSLLVDGEGAELGHMGPRSALGQRLAAQPPLEVRRGQPGCRSGGSKAVVRADVPDGAAGQVSAGTRVTMLPSSSQRLALAQTCAMDPYASAMTVDAAFGASRVAAYTGAALSRASPRLDAACPSIEDWRRSADLRRFFWACPRCQVTVSQGDEVCHACGDTRDALLLATAADETEALATNTRHIAYGRKLVRRRARPRCVAHATLHASVHAF